MRLVRLALPLCALLPLHAIEVGEDAPSEAIRRQFSGAYFRNGFHILAREPATEVRRFGSTGLIQEFVDAANAAGEDRLPHLALVKANTSDVILEGVETVFQVLPRMFTYYSSVGPNTAGYPITDTAVCTFDPANACQYQVFDRNHALFAYERALPDGQNLTVRDALFTRWRALGIGAMGPAVAAAGQITSGSGVTADAQRFRLGAIYAITSGLHNGRVLAVRQPIYDAFQQQNGHAGFLGLPTSEESAQPSGRRRQSFEGGAIEYTVGSAPELVLPVATISVSASSPVERLNAGDSFTLEAALFAANGALLEGRTVSWTTSNSRVLAIEPAGARVTVRAVGGGSATITAFSEGRSSRALTYFVVAPCCQVGEGSPTAAVQQSFQDAVTRNRLSVRLPAASPVRRVGAGFIQELTSADGSARYLLAKADARPSVYLVAGILLARYLELGGPAGALAYPTSDATAAGRQVFEGGALAGDPVVAVTGPVLARWAAQNYEAGAAGLPVSEARAVLSFAATAGLVQDFRRGLIAAPSTGPAANRAFFVGGLIASRYVDLGGAAGAFGFPATEETGAGGRRRQEFEGGAIEFSPGDAEAAAIERPRRPSIFANPFAVPAGSRVRIAAGGFPPRAALRISVSGRPDFLVETETGAYAWESFVSKNAPSGLVTLRAAEVNGTALAVGSYVVQAASETLTRLTKIRGDLQTGLPGARLPLPLRVAVADENGVPLPGVPVRFTPSPGASIEEPATVTDERGEAQAWLRLPVSELPALATAEAGRQVVTFSARSQASTLANFPRFTQNVAGAFAGGGGTIAEKGALLAAAAAIVRYGQNRGDLPAPNGPADVATLHAFLRDYCGFDFRGGRICDGFLAPPGSDERDVNPWRLAAFTGGNLDIEAVQPSPTSIRDRLAAGSPVLLALTLSAGDAVAGSHFVTAIGVAPNGSIVTHDSSPVLARATLEEYTAGFAAGGRNYRASIESAVVLAPRAPSALAFLVAHAAPSRADLLSAMGGCGPALSWFDSPAAAANRQPQRITYQACDGAQASYQLEITGGAGARASLTDLASPGAYFDLAGGAPWRIHRPESNWIADPLTAGMAAGSAVVNSASFLPEVSPGTLASVIGSGLSGTEQDTAVTVDGVPAIIVAATPFQINFEIPQSVPPGARTVSVRSPYGSAEKLVDLLPVSPAVFLIGGGRGAVLNEDGTVNGPANPAVRGGTIIIYCTGLGRTMEEGGLAVAESAVKVEVAGRTLDVTYAGAAPGFPGVYQVNVPLPRDLAPGLQVELRIAAGGVRSGGVWVAIE